jgi:hypothetical protein
MKPTQLTHPALNRALLARQGLLAPLDAPSLAAAFETVGAVQAQYWPAVAQSVFARTRGFTLADVYAAFERRELVVGSSIRGTVHAVSAAEHPVYAAVAELTGVDVVRSKDAGQDAGLMALRAAVLEFTADRPREAAEIQDFAKDWAARHPGELSVENLAHHEEHGWRPVYRSNALIRFPTDGNWATATGPKTYLTAPGRDADPDAALAALVRRHLSAFGPAAAEDVATWLGLRVPVARGVLDGFGDLVTYEDEAGRALYDVPDGILPDVGAAAPPRLLPKFDSPLLAYAAKHRRRIVADTDKEKVYLKALQVAATFLVDGFVAGTWSADVKKKTATLTLEPFRALTKADRKALTAEAERFLTLLVPDASGHAVAVADE